MSNTGNEQVVEEAEFDFWDFVNCSICHLPFTSSDRGPPVPFWITECGHVLCNNHLSKMLSPLPSGLVHRKLVLTLQFTQ
jgi:hypothetical protein